MREAHPEPRAEPCEIPATAGLSLVGTVVGLDDSSGNWKQIALALSFLLVGCNGTLPPAPKEVRIPVPVPCLTREQVPAKDFLPDAELAKLDDFRLVLALRVEQLKQRGWIDTTSALLEACVK